MKNIAIDSHKTIFNTTPQLTSFAPGRVNFIGEHTDYNGGLVMPLALDKGAVTAVSLNGLDKLRINSVDFKKVGEFALNSLKPSDSEKWANCIQGVVKVLIDKGHNISGLDLTIIGNIPIGSGLSSSAAVEVSVCYAINSLLNLKISREEIAFIAQKAEHEFTGTMCGIMDQMISVLGEENSLLKLSCDTIEFEQIPFILNDYSLLIVNSKVKHNLADSEYNIRRAECESAFNKIVASGVDIKTLSEYDIKDLNTNGDQFTEVEFKRVHHLLSENSRVVGCALSLKSGDLLRTGKLMTESHISLRDDYNVSCTELDFLVDNALGLDGVAGARMTGGGFGGCVIVLLKTASIEEYKTELKAYVKEFGVEPEIYSAIPSNGARLI